LYIEILTIIAYIKNTLIDWKADENQSQSTTPQKQIPARTSTAMIHVPALSTDADSSKNIAAAVKAVHQHRCWYW
jgi:hypothetical protein